MDVYFQGFWLYLIPDLDAKLDELTFIVGEDATLLDDNFEETKVGEDKERLEAIFDNLDGVGEGVNLPETERFEAIFDNLDGVGDGVNLLGGLGDTTVDLFDEGFIVNVEDLLTLTLL